MPMMIRHDAMLRVQMKVGRRVLSEQVVEAKNLDAHLTVQSYCYGGAFGQVNWHDGTGKPLDAPPRAHIKLVNPGDELAPGQPCPCPDCSQLVNA